MYHAPDHSMAANVPLLPGEVADTNVPEEVEHWAAVYEELTDFLLRVEPPQEMVERYRRRLEHWRCRRAQLDGAPEANGHSSGDALR
jgi:hypothetical protein